MSVTVIVCVVLGILLIGTFAYFRSYINKRTSRDAVLADIREEINRLLIRLDETTNRDITLIEDKEQSLRLLLGEIDKRLKIYAREMDRSLANEKLYREIGTASKNLNYRVIPDENPLPEPPLAKIAKEITVSKTPKASISEQIRQLDRSGLGSAIIASKLGISVSEVELALAVASRK